MNEIIIAEIKNGGLFVMK